MTILVVDTAGLFPLALQTVPVEELESYLLKIQFRAQVGTSGSHIRAPMNVEIQQRIGLLGVMP